MKRKKELALLLAALGGIVGYLLTRPFLFFAGEEGVLLAVPAPPGAAFSIRFIHSVQKTPVLENLVIDEAGGGFLLKSTKYQSFGVGLPFLLSEGRFYQEGDYFIFEDINRHFDELTLRTGVGTKLTILYMGTEYPLYRQLPAGSRVGLRIAPYYTRFF